MIRLSNISIQFSGRFLFDDISISIGNKDRIGLVGRNGTGKSTLLKLIAGEISPESGTISIPNDFTIGYLPQEGNTNSGRSVFEEASEALIEIRKLERRIDKLNNELSERKDYESDEYNQLITELSELNDRYHHIGGNLLESTIEKVLLGLGFLREEFSKPVSKFSGGWQMRVELAKLLLMQPNCILLDEPTNHLDIESIIWLESFLAAYSGSVIIVSHDKKFLNSVCNRTIEISLGKVIDQKLSYDDFIEFRITQRETQKNAYQNQQRQIAQTERFIERFKSKATLATRVQSRVKQLDKIERIEIEEEDTSKIRLQFPEAPRSSKLILETLCINKNYGQNEVLKNIEFAIERGERIAFVGKNGEGKSTLSKILANEEDYEGDISFGTNIHFGYYAQHQAESIDQESTVFDIIDRAATGEWRTKIRTLLGAFLFSGDDVYKKVKVLSGGERSRLALAKLLLKPINFMILDEPTNHLDMVAKDVLKNALMDYKGALIVVSHDRDFLSRLTDKTIEFHRQGITEYLGDINFFLEKKQIETFEQLEKKAEEKIEADPKKKSDAQLSREEKKKIDREKNRLEKNIEKVEKEIEDYELKIAEYDDQFSDPNFFNDIEWSQQAQSEYNQLKSELQAKMEEWEKLHGELDEVVISQTQINL